MISTIMSSTILRIGTRGSPLALAQAHETAGRLAKAHGVPRQAFEIVVIKTTGDAILDRPLALAGGKGLFTKEIDAAQLAGEVDIAVHSAKDLPAVLPDGLILAGFLPREDPRDALISRHGGGLTALPRGARVGAASLRRVAQLKRLRPDITTQLLRGNVQTRLAKVDAGAFDATFLALAGLRRLGLQDRVSAILDLEQFLPAAGQGAIAIAARAQDFQTADLLAPILDAETAVQLAAERAFLKLLDGSCRTPIAGYAQISGDQVFMRGQVLRTDGSESFEARAQGPIEQAAALGEQVAREILRVMPRDVLGAFAPHI